MAFITGDNPGMGDLELQRLIMTALVAAILFAIACFAWFAFNV
jgi:hypothetical protein